MKNKIIDGMLAPINTSGGLILSIFTTVWGLWLISPFWNVFATSGAWEYMAYAPEYFWGGLAITVGLAMTFGILRNSYQSLKFGSALGFYHWFTVSMFLFAGAWQNTAGLTYLMVAIYCGFIYVNVKVNHLPKYNADDNLTL